MLRKNKNLVVSLVFCSAIAASFSGWSQVPPKPESTERRSPVVLRPNEKTVMMSDMREYLKGIQAIIAALAKNDMDTVSTVAESLGTINIVSRPLMFPTASGARFRNLAEVVHTDFDELAVDAKTNRNATTTLNKLAPLMNRCVTCHDNYYITDTF